MDIKIKRVPASKKSTLARLVQLYLFELNVFYKEDLDSKGLYDYEGFDEYWTDKEKHPFIIYANGKIAGFAMISRKVNLPQSKNARSITEFFIMPKYRRLGLGKKLAFMMFDMFPGKWEISEITKNVNSHKFWRDVIGEYTNGNYKEVFLDTKKWWGPIQTFSNTSKL